MTWVDNLMKKLEDLEAKLAKEVEKQEAANAEHNAQVEEEIENLNTLAIDSTYPGRNLAELQLSVLRSQIRLLLRQWEKERK